MRVDKLPLIPCGKIKYQMLLVWRPARWSHVRENSSVGHSLSRETLLRITGVIVVALYALAFVAPGYQSISAGSIIPKSDDFIPGWRLAILGWLGPLELCFAWFANVPFFFCLMKMLRGRFPNRRFAIGTGGLAFSVLLPQLVYQPADGWHTGHLHGPAVWVWLSCVGITVFAGVMQRRNDSSTPQAAEPRRELLD